MVIMRSKIRTQTQEIFCQDFHWDASIFPPRLQMWHGDDYAWGVNIFHVAPPLTHGGQKESTKEIQCPRERLQYFGGGN